MLREIVTSPAFLVFILAGVSAGLRKAYTWTLNRGRRQVVDSVNETFVFEIATNHLPHIYDALKLIANNLQVELPDPPPIKWIPSTRVDGKE